MNRIKKKGVLLGLGLAVTAGYAGAALPDTGCDVSGLITDGITAMGAVAAVAVGGYVAFKIVKKALSWVGRAMG